MLKSRNATASNDRSHFTPNEPGEVLNEESALVLSLNPALVTAVSAKEQPVTIPRPDCSDFAGWLREVSSSDTLARQDAEQALAKGELPGFRLFQAVPSGNAKILECIFHAVSLPELEAVQQDVFIQQVHAAAGSEARRPSSRKRALSPEARWLPEPTVRRTGQSLWPSAGLK